MTPRLSRQTDEHPRRNGRLACSVACQRLDVQCLTGSRLLPVSPARSRPLLADTDIRIFRCELLGRRSQRALALLLRAHHPLGLIGCCAGIWSRALISVSQLKWGISHDTTWPSAVMAVSRPPAFPGRGVRRTADSRCQLRFVSRCRRREVEEVKATPAALTSNVPCRRLRAH